MFYSWYELGLILRFKSNFLVCSLKRPERYTRLTASTPTPQTVGSRSPSLLKGVGVWGRWLRSRWFQDEAEHGELSPRRAHGKVHELPKPLGCKRTHGPQRDNPDIGTARTAAGRDPPSVQSPCVHSGAQEPTWINFRAGGPTRCATC